MQLSQISKKLSKNVRSASKTLAKDPVSVGLLLLTAGFLTVAVYYFLRHSIFFFTDIGRDYLLLEDMAVKKLVLIGARTSLAGVFHGPLWHYLNLPAFVISDGNPVFGGWYLFGLSLLFLGSLFWVGKRLFNYKVGILAVALMSLHLVYLLKAMTNPAGSLFVMPLFIFTIMEYWRTHSIKYLIAHVFLGGLIVQFEMMVGVPLLMLSGLVCLISWFKTKKFAHILAFLVVLIPTSTFILFDLKHDFLQLRAIIAYVHGDNVVGIYSLQELIMQRINILTGEGIGLFATTDRAITPFNALGTGLFGWYLLSVIRKRTALDAKILFLMLYYIAFYVISMILNSSLLFHYWWPLLPIPLLAFAALSQKFTGMVKVIYIGVVVLALGAGVLTSRQQIAIADASINKIEDDWQFLTRTFSKAFEGSETDFGFFTYAPDIYAYEQKYTMSYLTKQHPEKTVHIYTKRPVTYILIAPPSGTDREKSAVDWKRDKIKLTRAPDEVFTMDAGYVIEKYNLSEAEVAEPTDPTMNDWIYFR